MDMRGAVSLFKTAGDTTRLRILKLLTVRECCVCELSGISGLSNSTVSEHLKKLKNCGLVTERKKSYWSYYSLKGDDPFINQFLALLNTFDDEQFLEDRTKLIGGAYTCSGVVLENPPGNN